MNFGHVDFHTGSRSTDRRIRNEFCNSQVRNKTHAPPPGLGDDAAALLLQKMNAIEQQGQARATGPSRTPPRACTTSTRACIILMKPQQKRRRAWNGSRLSWMRSSRRRKLPDAAPRRPLRGHDGVPEARVDGPRRPQGPRELDLAERVVREEGEDPVRVPCIDEGRPGAGLRVDPIEGLMKKYGVALNVSLGILRLAMQVGAAAMGCHHCHVANMSVDRARLKVRTTSTPR